MISSDIRRILEKEVSPAYVPLIAQMRFFVEPEVSCSRFFAEACFMSASLQTYKREGDRSALFRTELGDVLAKRLAGAIFIDIPCGLLAAREQEHDYDVIPFAHSFGVDACIEVDLTADVIRDRVPHVIDVTDGGTGYRLTQGVGEIGLRETDGLPVATMQDDLLGFISKLSSSEVRPPVALYLSGLQPSPTMCQSPEAQRTVVVPYLLALYDELDRVCGAGDTLILNSSAMLTAGVDDKKFPEVDAAVALFQRGFTLLRRCAYGKVHVYVKS